MIEIRNLAKTYHGAEGDFTAVKNINLTINDGDIFGIIGLSGAGKSTLVRCINLLEVPTEGDVLVDGRSMLSLSRRELLAARQKIGMIFQGFNLLSQRTALDNITYPLEIAGVKRAQAVKRARELLDMVGLAEKEKSYPSQLSGGQKQRVAIARALATEPHVLLCDEATSALDPTTTVQILDLLREINHRLGVTIVVITHEMRVIEKICNRVAVIDASEIAEEGLVSEVFLRPKSAIARRLIMPQGGEGIESVLGSRCIRVT
ncbi:MAG: ATP-binding cassette domain-containing protein, partial [Clostridiales bacterium]|nr:ATP-binding cassette domain-containing protein [Clostridiales bacterium]